MNDEILTGLKEVLKMVKPAMDTDCITPDTLLLEDLGLDSLTMLLMSLGIETKFQIRFDGSPTLVKVQDVIDYVQAKKQ